MAGICFLFICQYFKLNIRKYKNNLFFDRIFIAQCQPFVAQKSPRTLTGPEAFLS